MNALISFLLKSGGGLLRESAEAYIGGVLVRRTMEHLVRAIVVYALAGIFSLAALVFLYVFLYHWLSERMGDDSAAAILCGGSLLIVALVFFVQWLMNRQPKPVAKAPGGILGSLGEGRSFLNDENLEAGIAAGMEIGRRLRKSAPEIALAAGLVGLVVGIRPELLNLIGGRSRKPKNQG